MLSIPHISRNEQRRRRRGTADPRQLLLERSSTDDAVSLLPPVPAPIALTLLPDSAQLAIVDQPLPPPCVALQTSQSHALSTQSPQTAAAVVARARRMRRKTKNCRNLSRYGYDYAGFRRVSARETAMQLELERMQQQIWELEQTRVLMQSIQLVRHANAAGLVADKVYEYYRHFARGYNPSVNRDHGALLESLLRSIMLDDVESPAFHDLDTFLLQWKNYSRYHAKVVLDVESITPIASDDHSMYLIKVQGQSTLRISRDTIKHFFQPILDDEAMVQRLIGQEYVFPFVTLFYFNLDGRVFKMEPRADLATGLFNLVSDPLSTVKLLGASQLTDDGCLHAYTDLDDEPVLDTDFLDTSSADTSRDDSSTRSRSFDSETDDLA